MSPRQRPTSKMPVLRRSLRFKKKRSPQASTPVSSSRGEGVNTQNQRNITQPSSTKPRNNPSSSQQPTPAPTSPRTTTKPSHTPVNTTLPTTLNTPASKPPATSSAAAASPSTPSVSNIPVHTEQAVTAHAVPIPSTSSPSAPEPSPKSPRVPAPKPTRSSVNKAPRSRPVKSPRPPTTKSLRVRTPPINTTGTEDEPDIIEVPVEQTPRGVIPHAPPFSISDFDFVSGYVSMDAVRVPVYASREVHQQHVEFLKNLFATKSFNPVIGALMVTQEKEGINATQLDKTKMLVGDCLLVDGRHRFQAIRELYLADKEKWSHLWNRAPIACVERKDGRIISTMEMLALSAYFNALSSAVLKVSLFDHLHAAIQTASLSASLQSCHVGELAIGEITKQLKERRTLGDIDERQLRRYASVAHKLAQRPDFYKCLKTICSSCPGIGLVHLNSSPLLSITDVSLWQLALSSIRALVINGVKGSFELMHVRFYNCIKQLFGVLRRTANYKKLELGSLLDSELYITAHNPKTVHEYIADTMSRYAIVENQDQADKTRVRNLKKKLVQLLGEDIEPPEPLQPSVSTAVQPESVKKSTAGYQTVVSEDNTASGPRRSTRKRKNVEQNSNDESVEYGETRRPTKKRKAKAKATSSKGQPTGDPGVSLSEATVSTFLMTLNSEELTRLMDSLGVQVITHQEGSRTAMRAHATDDIALEATLPVGVLPSFYDSFDDSLPGTLPEAYADPQAYTGPGNPSWVRFLTKLPSKWPNDNPVAHITPWLEALHIPHEHRAHSVITNREILRQNHHVVYYRAAHSYYKQRPVSELPDVSPRFRTATTTNEKLWCSAVVEDEAALEFFGEKKEQLATEGFCILEGFLNDDQMPNKIGNFSFPSFSCPQPFFKSLEDEAVASFPGEQSLTNPATRSTWNIMQNVSSSVDSNAVIQGQGRFRMTNYGILERLETDPDKLWTITGRALVDIRIAQCMAALKLTQKLGSRRIFMPRTGGRWILTSLQCQRQALHTDFKALTRHETLTECKSPGYFTMATGNREIPIWVCSHSHRLAATSSTSKIRAASSVSCAHVIRIPPFSVFVGRGDLYYSGLATADSIGNQRSIYYHTYFILEGAEIPRVLAGSPHFKPSFTANIDEESEEDVDKLPISSNTGSVKKPRALEGSDDEYQTDEIAQIVEDAPDDDDEDSQDVDYSEYL